MNLEFLLVTAMKVLGVKADPVEIAAIFEFAKTAIPVLVAKVEALETSLARIEANQKQILDKLETKICLTQLALEPQEIKT